MTDSATAARTGRSIVVAVLVVAAFGWVMFLPVSHNEFLYPLYSLIALSALVFLIRRNPHVDVHVWAIGFLLAGLGVYGMLLGIINPDPIFTVAVYFAAPALYLACVAAATETTLRLVLVYAATIATIAVTGVLLVFIVGEMGLIPQIVPDWVITNLDLKATFRDGSSQARSWGLSSMAALGPIWMASLFVWKNRFLPPWGVRLLCAVLALVTVAISDRKAIVLVMAIAPLIALVIRITLFRTSSTRIPGPRRPAVWIAIGAAVVVAAIALLPRLINSGPVANVLAAIGSFFGATVAVGDSDQSIRAEQAWYMLQGWAMNPIFGSGFRAPIPGYSRAAEIPWSLELQYHLLLFNVGLVGITIALAALIAGLLYVRKAVVARPDFTAILVVTTTGALAMLVANATNPYLVAPGHQWAVFLPLAVATVALHRPERRDADVQALKTPRGSIVR